MREILFRGKRVDNGEWVEGDLVINKPSSAYRIFKDFANVKHGDYTESGMHECSGLLYNVIPESVGQFTGLCDKNGKKIFEGDILRVYEDVCGEIKTWDNQVCFKNAEFALYDPNCCEVCKNGFGITCSLSEAHCLWEIEIIGNIHVNHAILTK